MIARSQGLKVVVTGAASGIGLATVDRLLGDGARVLAVDLAWPDDHRLLTVAETRTAQCDVGDEDAVSSTLAAAATWLGGIDAVVHVAGTIRANRQQVDDVARSDWDAVLGTNLTGAYLVAKHAVRYLERTSGALILVGSGAGVFNPHGSVPYAASKGGLHGLAITLEAALHRRGVRVVDVAPGAVDTPLLRRQSAEPEQIDDRVAAGKIIGADKVAALLAFLASPDASAVRGTLRTW